MRAGSPEIGEVCVRCLTKDAARTVGVTAPFLKWAGGKARLLGELLPRLPPAFEVWREPFLGGGSVLFAAAPARASVSDYNVELIDTYRAVRDGVDGVVDALSWYSYDKREFYLTRKLRPEDLAPAERAARMIYLNRTCFNGLYRVNRRGRFNTPFGQQYTNPTILDEPRLRAASAALQRVELRACDWRAAAARAVPGDFVYFDPPYVPASPTASFTAYQAGGFGLADQEELAATFDTLTGRGVLAMLSNSDTQLVRGLYGWHRIDAVTVRRSISRRRSASAGEVIVRNY